MERKPTSQTTEMPEGWASRKEAAPSLGQKNASRAANETAPPKAKKAPKAETNPYPWYSPRFWHGMRPLTWWKLMAVHGFRIHPIRWPMAFLISLITPLNTLFAVVQWLLNSKRIDEAKIEHP